MAALFYATVCVWATLHVCTVFKRMCRCMICGCVYVLYVRIVFVLAFGCRYSLLLIAYVLFINIELAVVAVSDSVR